MAYNQKNLPKIEVIYTNEETRKIREFKPKHQDYFVAEILGFEVDLSGKVEEMTIANFCRSCDSLQADGVCRLVGANDQARYAVRDWCGWAMVNGVRGQMTNGGFKKGSS